MHVIYVWGSELFVDLFAGSVTSAMCAMCGQKTSALGSGERGVARCLDQLSAVCPCLRTGEYVVEVVSSEPKVSAQPSADAGPY